MSKYEKISLDTECTGLHSQYGGEPFLFTFCDENLKTSHVEFSVNPKTRKVRYTKAGLLEVRDKIRDKTVVFHHAKFDINMTATAGLYLYIPEWRTACQPINFERTEPVAKFRVNAIEDTFNSSHICYSDEQHGLKYLASRYLDIKDDDEKALKQAVVEARRIGKAKGWNLGITYKGEAEPLYDYWMPKAANPKSKECLTYGLKDAYRTMLLHLLLEEIMEENPSFRKSYEEEMDLVGELYAMERLGITLHKRNLRLLTQEIKAKIAPQEKIVLDIGKKRFGKDFNYRSPIHLPQLLFGYAVHTGKRRDFEKKSFGLPVLWLTKGKSPCCDKEIIPRLIKHCKKEPKKHATALKFLEAKQDMSKFIKGAEALASYKQASLNDEVDSRLHNLQFSLNQNGTRLTRLSSSDPFNSQNVSKKAEVKVRSVFTPRKGCVWYSIDGTQLELAILAYASQDKRMLKAIADREDFHDMVMRELFAEEAKKSKEEARTKAKAVNFRVVYGGDGAAIDAIGGPGTYKRFAARFPGLPDYMEATIAFCKKHGYIETLSGRRLYVDVRRAKTKAVNGVIQGTAGEWGKRCISRISKKGLVDWQTSRIVLQIHDELILEYPKSEPLSTISAVCKEMRLAARDLNFKVGVDVKLIRNNWAEKEPVDL
jgi:DNA polymerase I-like protein with 3'-5' exonuclease and polymerase domains